MTTREDEATARWIAAWIIGFCLTVGLAVKCSNADAAPLAVASQDGAVITLTDEPCAVAEVSNLPYRATWTDKGQTWEGCFTVHPAGIVVMFFGGDRTVAIAPRSAFTKAQSI